jgi:hypothetical protein
MNDLLSTSTNNSISTNRNMGIKELILYWKFLKEDCGERIDDKESLDDNANVSDEIRRVIDNGFHSIHPFMYRSKHLKDFLQIINNIRSLPVVDFDYSIEAINRLVMRNLLCPRCHGKGLAYLKLLTKNIADNKFMKYISIYERFTSLDNWGIDYEKDISRLMEKYNINILD